MNINKFINAFKNIPRDKKEIINIIVELIIFLIIIGFILILISCGKPKNVGVEKKYTLKVVFMDNSEDTLIKLR